MDIRKFFRRKRKAQEQEPAPQPLRIEGIGPAPLTPEPDEAELAAQALLEHMIEVSSSKFQVPSKKRNDKAQGKDLNAEGVASDKRERSGKPETSGNAAMKPETRDADYYKELASRIRQAHETATQRTLRFVAFVEQELQKPSLPLSGPGSLGLLQTELYKRLDVIERRGGELKKRWQHCLATVIVRRMQAESNEDDNQSE